MQSIVDTDVIEFCSRLIRCKSLTPNDDGAVDYIENFLSAIGFKTKIFQDTSSEIKNLFAEYGNSDEKSLGFIGHSDVVPAGKGWTVDPFAAIQKDGLLIGRGVADMKGGISAFCCSLVDFIHQGFIGKIKIFITGDEEVGSYAGIRSLIDWAKENNNIPHACVIGEPSSDKVLGDRIYLGHRGSLNVMVKSLGIQGHVAYNNNYKNSLNNICRYIVKMMDYQWKHTDKRFPQINLEPTMLFTNNYATNVVPEESSANINIRFGADYSMQDIKNIFQEVANDYEVVLSFAESGNAYYCDNEKLKNNLSAAIREITNVEPVFSAAGGTSDGRYMIKHCDVIEFGVSDASIHQKNENAKIQDLRNLQKIYSLFLKKYFY